jgi:long-subunit acyl-CoA synthetase (AMP-forming)
MEKIKEISMAAVFQNRAREHGEEVCVAYRNDAGQWFDVSWDRMNEMVHNLAYYLMAKGIQHGDKVAVFSPNRYEWWIADMAILSIGAVNIPIYATNTAGEARYILDNSDSRICFVGTQAQMEKIVAVRDRLPKLMEIVIFNDLAEKADRGKRKPMRRSSTGGLRPSSPTTCAPSSIPREPPATPRGSCCRIIILSRTSTSSTPIFRKWSAVITRPHHFYPFLMP